MRKVIIFHFLLFIVNQLFTQNDPMKEDPFNMNKPSVSQRAEVSQKIGIGFITINYSRPNARGRKIFGGLLKHNEVWRLGADYQTTIDFQHSFVVVNDTIPKGKYALYAVPNKEFWTIYFNRDIDGWGQYSYNSNLNIYEFEIPVEKTLEYIETFTIGFMNTSMNNGELYFQWENSRIRLPITIGNAQRKEILLNFEYLLGENKKSLGYKYFLTSEYFYLEEQEYEKALSYLQKALDNGLNTYYVHFLRAEIFYALGKRNKAINEAKEAKKRVPLNSNDSDWLYRIDKAILNWTSN